MTFTLPVSRTPDPMDAPPLRWGMLGTGWIAERFVEALHAHTRQRVVVVGSRTAEKGAEFAARHGIERSTVGYEAVAADPAVVDPVAARALTDREAVLDDPGEIPGLDSESPFSAQLGRHYSHLRR